MTYVCPGCGERKWTADHRWRCLRRNPLPVPTDTPRSYASFTPEAVNQIRSVARRAAARFGRVDMYEDFAQSILLRCLTSSEELYVPRNLDNAFIDYMRAHLGRPESFRNAESYAEALENLPALAAPAPTGTWRDDLPAYGIRRAILIMIKEWDFSISEVADCFGVIGAKVEAELYLATKERVG